MTPPGRITVGDGCALACRVEGPEGAPVVLLSPSLGTTMAMWDAQAAVLAGRFRVIRYDPRGHGGSDAPPGAYGLDRLAQDAVELLDGLGVRRATFCGLSMGGMVGQRLGVVAPDRFPRLVLACTSAYMGPPVGWEARIEAVARGGMGALADAVIERWFTPGFRAGNAASVARARAMLLETPPQGYAGCCAALRDMDQRATARLVSAETLVITGVHDRATPPADGLLLADRISDARHLQLDAAHLANVEAQDAFNTALIDFMQ